MTATETPTAKLLRLTAETQELIPEHTFKAFMYRVNARESIKDQCELLSEGLEKREAAREETAA